MTAEGCRILVVDDMPDAASTLARMVKLLGHVADFVTDPRLAVDCARTFQPKLVFLDIGMPYINGYELAPMLRKALSPGLVRIVALTAWGSDKDKEHCAASGFDAHLLKPASEKAIAGMIDKFC